MRARAPPSTAQEAVISRQLSPHFEFSVSDFEFENPGALSQNPKFAIPNPKSFKLTADRSLLFRWVGTRGGGPPYS